MICFGIVVYIIVMEEQQFYQIKVCFIINGGRQEEVYCVDVVVIEGYDRVCIVF